MCAEIFRESCSSITVEALHAAADCMHMSIRDHRRSYQNIHKLIKSVYEFVTEFKLDQVPCETQANAAE